MMFMLRNMKVKEMSKVRGMEMERRFYQMETPMKVPTKTTSEMEWGRIGKKDS